LREPARLRAWLFGIAHRALIDRFRQQYAEPPGVPVDDVDLAEPDSRDDAAEALELLHEELHRLPLIEREVLVLFYLEELTLAQLAEALGIPVGTVKSRLFRARGLLRQQLTNRGAQR